MDLVKLSIAEIRDFGKAQLRECEQGVRRELAAMRMDVYTAQAASSGKKRALRKQLARVMTIKNQSALQAAASKA